MVDYQCEEDEKGGTSLSVHGDEVNVMLLSTKQIDDGQIRQVSVYLKRDAVAALHAQLGSWLERVKHDDTR